MLSRNDLKIIENVLQMSQEELEKFAARLEPGSLGYLDNIMDQYEKSLDQN